MGHFDEVEVLETYTGSWVGGYEVADEAVADQEAFLVRRQHDGTVLPEPISADRIRPAHSAPPSGR